MLLAFSAKLFTNTTTSFLAFLRLIHDVVIVLTGARHLFMQNYLVPGYYKIHIFSLIFLHDISVTKNKIMQDVCIIFWRFCSSKSHKDGSTSTSELNGPRTTEVFKTTRVCVAVRQIEEQKPKINNKRVISMEGTFLGTPCTPVLPWLCVMVVQEPEGECIIGHVIPKHKLWA